MSLKNLLKLSNSSYNYNLKNLVKLQCGGAAAAAVINDVDCSDVRIYTLKNDGGQNALGSDRQNQCMWISIYDFLHAHNKKITFEDVIKVAGVEQHKNTMFDIDDPRFNSGPKPLWACHFCKKNGEPLINEGFVICPNCREPGVLSYPLQRLANKYNIIIQFYKVTNLYFEKKRDEFDDTNNYIVLDRQGGPGQEIPSKGFYNIQPIKNPISPSIVHIAQYPMHFELIVCGHGVNVDIPWKILNKESQRKSKLDFFNDTKIALEMQLNDMNEQMHDYSSFKKQLETINEQIKSLKLYTPEQAQQKSEDAELQKAIELSKLEQQLQKPATAAAALKPAAAPTQKPATAAALKNLSSTVQQKISLIEQKLPQKPASTTPQKTPSFIKQQQQPVSDFMAMFKQIKLPQQQVSAAAVKPISSNNAFISCKKCTFENPLDKQKCQLCENPLFD